jgi:N-acetylglucosamine repressor
MAIQPMHQPRPMPAATSEKATHQLTRRSNERLVLRTVYEHGPLSRADVARATGLTRTTVSDVVEGLIVAGLTREVGVGPSTGGKAPILLEVPADARHLVGVDVDRDRVSGAIVNLRGQVRGRAERDLADCDGPAAMAALASLVEELVASASRPLAGVGVGTPGLVDTSSGTVRWAVGLDWRDLAVGPRLALLTGLPVVVVNDSQAAAMAEWAFGGHDNSSAMIVVKVGEGIGAGIVIAGRLHVGDDSGAGEIGHTRMGFGELPCRCGGRGCLETVASLRAVLERAQALAPESPDSTLSGSPVTRSALLAAFAAGDALARSVVLESARPLGGVLGAMIGTLGARKIVLVGAMTAFGQPWLDAVRAETQRSALALLVEQAEIDLGTTGSDVVELGAAAILMASELGLALAA